MRKLATIVGLVVALAVPATAAAHSDYYNTTISGSGWSSTFIDTTQPPPGFTALQCWQTANLYPGQTLYVYNIGDGSANAQHLGWSVFKDWHIHYGDVQDFVTGAETRQFVIDHSPPDPNSTIGTRRVW